MNTLPIIPLPHDPELERRILAGFLNAPEAIPESQPDYFYQESHRQIYRAMRSEIEQGNTPDVFSISSLLPEYKEQIFEIEKLGFFDVIVMEKQLKMFRDLYEKRKSIEYLKLSSCKLEDGHSLDEVIPGLMAQMEALKAGPKRQELVTQAAGEWVRQEITPPISIIPGCMDAGTKADIGGGSKLRKSWFTLQMAVCVAAGIDFLGFHLYGVKRKVLLFNLEISEYYFQKRLQRVMLGLGVSPDDIAESLIIVNCRGQKVDFTSISATAAGNKPDIVVLDPFYKLVEGNENAAETYRPILACLDSIIAKNGAAVLKVMHYSKGFAGDKATIDRFAGSGILARDYDVSFNLTAHAEGDDFAVLEVINRNYPPRPAESIFFDIQRHIFFKDARRPIVKTKMNSKADGVTDRDNAAYVGLQLQTILEKPMPKTSFIEELHNNGLSLNKARAYCDSLLHDGTLEIWSRPKEKNLKIIGYPGAIARLKDSENNERK